MWKLSIITPSFNQAQYLPQTIESVVSQGYPRLEYLILDGGSTDGSVAIINRYARKYPGIIWWRSKPDAGQVAAINEGLRRASGDIVAYLNSDDYYLPGTFESVVGYFSQYPLALWLVGDCQVTDPKLEWTFGLKKLWPVHLWPPLLLVANTINQPAVFLTRKLIKQIGRFDGQYDYAFDYDYWLRCSRVARPSRINRPLAVFRAHTQAKGSRGWRRQFGEELAICRRYTASPLVILFHTLAVYIIRAVYGQLKLSA